VSVTTASLRCDQCAEPAFAVAPGDEPKRDLFLLKRDVPMQCWCQRHWRERYGVAAAA
jgi:hypothetical protein